MPIVVRCACGKEYHFKDEYAGRRAKCPACGQVVRIPGARPAGRPSPHSPLREDRRSRTMELVLLGSAGFVVLVGIGLVVYFLFFSGPSPRTARPAASSPATQQPSAAASEGPAPVSGPSAPAAGPVVAPGPASVPSPSAIPAPPPPPAPSSGPAWARMIVDGSFAVTEGGLGIVAGYGDEATKPDGTFYASLTQGSPTVAISRYAHVVPSNPDEEWAEIHPETLNKQLSLEETIRKYGTPTRITRCPCNLGLASGTQERTVLYHWYGPLAIMTEEDGKTLAGMAFRLPLLKEIYKEGNNLLAVARRHLQDAPDSSKPKAESAAPPSSGTPGGPTSLLPPAPAPAPSPAPAAPETPPAASPPADPKPADADSSKLVWARIVLDFVTPEINERIKFLSELLAGVPGFNSSDNGLAAKVAVEDEAMSLGPIVAKYGEGDSVETVQEEVAYGRKDSFVRHTYGPLSLYVQKSKDNVHYLSAPLEWCRQGLRAKAAEALKEKGETPSSGNDKSSSMVPAPASQEDVRRLFGIGVAVKPLPPEAADTLRAKAPEIAAGFSDPEWGEYKEDPTRKDGLWLVATVKKSLKLEEVVARAGQEESRETEGDRTWHKYGWIYFGVISDEVKFVRVDVLRMLAVVLALAEQEKAASQ